MNLRPSNNDTPRDWMFLTAGFTTAMVMTAHWLDAGIGAAFFLIGLALEFRR